jgi:hypothetical protein
MIDDLITCDKARIPVVLFVTQEELRAESEIVKYAEQQETMVWIWSLTSNKGVPGWEPPTDFENDIKYSDCPFDQEKSASPEGAVKALVDTILLLNEQREYDSSISSKIIAIFRDTHSILKQDLPFVRMLRDTSKELKNREGCMLICLSPDDYLPIDLEVDVIKIYPGLPKKSSINKMVVSLLDEFKIDNFNEIEDLTDSCIGLTLNQAADAIGKSLVKYNATINLNFIREEKTKVISSKPGLTYVKDVPSIEQVGGLGGIKEWLRERKKGFSQEARDQNLPIPRGILCIGISGAGKSLLAKAASSYLKMPLIKLNPPDLKGSLVGETERNFRTARDAIDSLGNCVVWIDELEKSISGNTGKNLDGGTSDALLQGFLHWMQEKKGGSFVVSTANSLEALPPELLRKGRWDAIFFVDLPSFEERMEIFRIHLNMRKWELSNDEISKLASETENYSGAEIEAACIDGRWKAFNDDRELEVSDVSFCIKQDVPLYVTMQEKIVALRKWAKTRARPASLIKKENFSYNTNRQRKRKIVLDPIEKVDKQTLN